MNAVRQRYDSFHGTLRAIKKLSGDDVCSDDETRPTVSVTSFPARIDRLHITLATILRQSVKPHAVVVSLSSSEFPGRRLPRRLDALRERGVAINWVEGNERSYKKLLPALVRHPDRSIVTIDDDILYPPEWLETLTSKALQAPQEILGMRGTAISGPATPDGLDPYLSWRPATPETASGRTFLTGMGGILYPPRSLAPEATDFALATRLCPTADDIWFKAMALKAGTRVRRAIATSAEYPTTLGSQKISLRAINIDTGANDRQLRSVLDHFDLWDALDD